MIVTDDRVAHFVGKAVNQIIYPPYTCIGVEQVGGGIVAGAVLNCFTGPDIQVTVAVTDKHAAGALTRHVGRYVFDQMKCERITVITEQPKVVAYACRLGGQIEGTLRNMFGKGRDGVLIGILRDDWKVRI